MIRQYKTNHLVVLFVHKLQPKVIYFFGRVYVQSVGAGAAARGTLKTSLNIKTDERKGQGAER